MCETKTWLILKSKDLEAIYNSPLKYHKISFEKEILKNISQTFGLNYFFGKILYFIFLLCEQALSYHFKPVTSLQLIF